MNHYLFWKRFAQGKLKTHVSSIKIRIPSPKEILSWSERRLPNSTLVGKIDNAHTVEHDTLRPVSGGLFCERIFGPIATNVCACLRRKGWNENYCKICEVQFTKSRLRRYQMGHILLAAPVVHIWALQGGNLASLLGKKNLGIRSIAYGKVMCQSKLWTKYGVAEGDGKNNGSFLYNTSKMWEFSSTSPLQSSYAPGSSRLTSPTCPNTFGDGVTNTPFGWIEDLRFPRKGVGFSPSQTPLDPSVGSSPTPKVSATIHVKDVKVTTNYLHSWCSPLALTSKMSSPTYDPDHRVTVAKGVDEHPKGNGSLIRTEGRRQSTTQTFGGAMTTPKKMHVVILKSTTVKKDTKIANNFSIFTNNLIVVPKEAQKNLLQNSIGVTSFAGGMHLQLFLIKKLLLTKNLIYFRSYPKKVSSSPSATGPNIKNKLSPFFLSHTGIFSNKCNWLEKNQEINHQIYKVYERGNILPFHQFILYKPDSFDNISGFFSSLNKQKISLPLPHYSNNKLNISNFNKSSLLSPTPPHPRVIAKGDVTTERSYPEGVRQLSPRRLWRSPEGVEVTANYGTTLKVMPITLRVIATTMHSTSTNKIQTIAGSDGIDVTTQLYQKDTVRNFGVFNQFNQGNDIFKWIDFRLTHLIYPYQHNFQKKEEKHRSITFLWAKRIYFSSVGTNYQSLVTRFISFFYLGILGGFASSPSVMASRRLWRSPEGVKVLPTATATIHVQKGNNKKCVPIYWLKNSLKKNFTQIQISTFSSAATPTLSHASYLHVVSSNSTGQNDETSFYMNLRSNVRFFLLTPNVRSPFTIEWLPKVCGELSPSHPRVIASPKAKTQRVATSKDVDGDVMPSPTPRGYVMSTRTPSLPLLTPLVIAEGNTEGVGTYVLPSPKVTATTFRSCSSGATPRVVPFQDKTFRSLAKVLPRATASHTCLHLYTRGCIRCCLWRSSKVLASPSPKALATSSVSATKRIACGDVHVVNQVLRKSKLKATIQKRLNYFGESYYLLENKNRKLCNTFLSRSHKTHQRNQIQLNIQKIVNIQTSKGKLTNVRNIAYTGSSVLFQTLKNFNLVLLDTLTNWKWKKAKLQLNSLLLQNKLTKKKRNLRNKLARVKIVFTKRKSLVQSFLNTKQLPEWMILSILPVLPPSLRPILELEPNNIVVSDLNVLYQTVIRRNDALMGLLTFRALEIDILNRQVSLQQSIEKLFDKGAGTKKRPVKSLSQGFHGKKGLFRSHLLGKRVDYSGRSVIVVGPQLKLHECGLPKEMALVLFLPFLIARLKKRKIVNNTSQAKQLIINKDKQIWINLKSLIYEHPVLLNRAPTLHRLGFQAFQPILVSGKAMILPALVCTGFNADFDGDQMAVHVPLSHVARAESWKLLHAKNNMLSPATGKPIIVLSQEMILGCYCSTLILNKTFISKLKTNRSQTVHLTSTASQKVVHCHARTPSITQRQGVAVAEGVGNTYVPTRRLWRSPVAFGDGVKVLPITQRVFAYGDAIIFDVRRGNEGIRVSNKGVRGASSPITQGVFAYGDAMMQDHEASNQNNYFTTFQEIYNALGQNKIALQTAIWLRIPFFEDNQFLEEPLEIRLDARGHFFRFYCQSQRHFSKDIKSRDQMKGVSYIRTSAGRIQLNETFYSSILI